MNIRSDIVALIREGKSDRAVARELRVRKDTVGATRRALGVPPVRARHTLTVEQLWDTYARPIDSGHVMWTGPVSHCGTPTVSRHQRTHSARGIAFRRRYGRDPVGYVRPACDFKGCVAPDHVADRPMREQLRTQYNAIFGGAL